jgi:ABC-type multidrug transport system fused ATPase/permease subunit
MSFWDFIWFVLWSYIFFAYLMFLFGIIADIFRDSELGGGMKAVWMFFLIFLPFLTAIIYLIARGRGMAERQLRASEHARSQSEAYIRSVASSSPAEEIAKAKALLDSGTISQQEFEGLKSRAMS